MRRMRIALLALALLAGCGGSGFYAGGFDAAPEDAPAESDPPDAVTVADAGVEAAATTDGGDAATGSCAFLGQACAKDTDCVCSAGSGCAHEDFHCNSSKQCEAVPTGPGAINLDAGQCCADCQRAYEYCGPGALCVGNWQSCINMCGSCPVGCVTPAR